MILGDLNARTGTLEDFISNGDDDYDDYVPVPSEYESDRIKDVRTSMDLKSCPRGKELLDMCISSRIRILNGRTFGDYHGQYTSYQYNGNSVIDYCLVSEDFMDNVLYFYVDDPILRLSDHSKVSVRLMASMHVDTVSQKLEDFPTNFKWDSVSPELFVNALKSEEIKVKINELQNFESKTCCEVERAVESLQDILLLAANKSLKRKTKVRGRGIKSKPWFDLNLCNMRKELDHKSDKLARFPNDPIIRGNFFKFRKLYSKTCKMKYRQYKANLIQKLDNLFENDPSKYWELLNKLKYDDEKKSSGESNIPADEWVEYFKILNTVPSGYESRIKEIKSMLCSLEQHKTFSDLDYKVTENEVIKALHTLKNGKSTGLDCVSNEMLKCSESILLPCFVKLFNSILCTGFYPKQWKTGYIVPIFKSGSRSDPSDYRGIAIISCIGKLFNSLINIRLDNYLDKFKIISETQIGFQKRARTVDHMFILRTLIEKCFSDKKYLYTCFVDFRKAFDSVVHEALLLKLQKIGIGGYFYNVIKNMYFCNILQVRTCNKLTKNFNADIGVRQGDNLSPNLFKIFVNDLPSIFDEYCDPASIGDRKLNCLLYADDVVLFSTTELGLKKCLARLEDYCTKWCIQVNIKKTKVIIFNKSGRIINCKFYFNGETIENVRHYKYLGVIFSASGSFSIARHDLYQRGLKAFFKLRSSFGDNIPKIDSCLHIFDHTIKPILTYGSEVWGTCVFGNKKDIGDIFEIEKKFAKFDCENLCMKFYKYILGVHKKSSNLAVMGELGRTPLHIQIICSVLKFLQRLKDLDDGHLLRQALFTSIEVHKHNMSSWYTSILYILKCLNIDVENFDIDTVKDALIRRYIYVLLEI